jgi:hypothetical protein
VRLLRALLALMRRTVRRLVTPARAPRVRPVPALAAVRAMPAPCPVCRCAMSEHTAQRRAGVPYCLTCRRECPLASVRAWPIGEPRAIAGPALGMWPGREWPGGSTPAR